MLANRPERVVIIDHLGVKDDLNAIASALQMQLRRDFCPAYDVEDGIVVSAVASDKDIRPEDWVIGLFDKPDQPGALGYHDTTLAGLPLSKVFPLLDAQDGSPLSTTISHELLEMIADPYLCLAVQSSIDGKFWAYEVCDAVESDSYQINGVAVSNFVYPQYFMPPKNTTGCQFDQMKLITHPYEVRPGGYMQWNKGAGWHQIVHRDQAPRAYRMRHDSRGSLRVASTLFEADTK